MIKLGVLISGSGTNLQAIIDAIAAGTLDASVEIVISSKPEALGLQRAAKAGIQTMSFDRDMYAKDPLMVDALIAEELKVHECDYVVMAGYMRKVSNVILDTFPDRVLNIHPALLPSFAGAHGIVDTFNHGNKVGGITVHFANAVYDDGPIIAQRAVEIREDDTVESFEERIHEAEHELYPQVLQLLAEGRVSIERNEVGRRVVHIS